MEYDYVYLQICINHSECTDTNAHTIVFVHTTIHPHNTYNTSYTTTTHTTMCMQDGFFPLFSASQEGHDSVVEKLHQAGATVDLQDKVENCVLLSIVV